MRKPVLFVISIAILVSCQEKNAYLNDIVSFSTEPPVYYNAQPQPHNPILDTLSNGLVVEVTDTAYVLEEDILLSSLNIEAISEPTSRGAVLAEQTQFYWPSRIVYYDFSSNFAPYKRNAMDAMNNISNVSGIRFIEKDANTSNYIHFNYSTSGNNSPLGMQGGKQVINIYNTESVSVITHEILHSLGLFHEQSRTDRDDYIDIDFDNIRPSKRHNFNKYTAEGYTGYNIGPFDYNSIMMYNGHITDSNFVYDTSINTITIKNTNTATTQGDSLSIGDISAIRSIYGPPYHRLEDTLVEVLEENDTYYEELYEVRRNASIHFYEDVACTIPATLQYPRLIKVEIDVDDCSSYGQLSHYTRNRTILVPAGVQSYGIETYVNHEYYQYSTPSNVHTQYFSIVNSHVPDYRN